MAFERFTNSVNVCRRDTVNFVLSFPKPLPSSWEDLQLVFKSDSGRISKFIKNSDVTMQPTLDGNSVQYSFRFTIDGTDPVGTFKLLEGAVRLHDGFIIHWNPQAGSGAETFTLTVDYTPERIEAVDAVAESKSAD